MVDRSLSQIRPQVRALTGYHVAVPPHTIKLNQNESSLELPAAIKDAILKRLRLLPWSRYSGHTTSELHAALRKALSLPTEVGVVTGNGSNELIQALLLAVLEKDTKIVLPVPTFLLYRQIATILGAMVVEVPLRADLTCDVERLMEAVERAQAKAVVLARPNNPTGTVMSVQGVERLLGSTECLVVVDEAYHEFAADTVLSLLPGYDNLVVLRTFSKALRSAGLRIGYLVAQASLAEQIAKVLPPFNMGIMSSEAALEILAHRELLRPGIEETISQRSWLFGELQRIDGITPFPSQANFVCFRTTKQPRLVFDRLLEQGILVRDVSGYPMLAECLRVTVGSPEENRAFVTALRAIMEDE